MLEWDPNLGKQRELALKQHEKTMTSQVVNAISSLVSNTWNWFSKSSDKKQ